MLRALAISVPLVWASIVAAQAAGQEDVAPGVYARVIVDRADVRSGPGATYQRIAVGERGEVFRVVARANRGYWFRVELPDATLGWVHGDTVYNHQVSRERAQGGRFLPEVFAPPALLHATGEFAVQFGVLGLTSPNGFMAVRPSLVIAPELELEANLAGAVGKGGQLLIGSGGALINIFPDSPVVPFLTVGGGMALSDPNADTFLLNSGILGVLYGGGGIRVGFRYRITFRFEGRGYVFFHEDRVVELIELSGGLTVFM